MLQNEAPPSIIRHVARRHTSVYFSEETLADLEYLVKRTRSPSMAAALEQAVAEQARELRHQDAMRAAAIARRSGAAALSEPPPAAPAPKKRAK